MGFATAAAPRTPRTPMPASARTWLLLLLLAVLSSRTSEASLMGKGGGLLGGRFQNQKGQKPWDHKGRNSNYWYYEEDDALNGGKDGEDMKSKPCVGLCYYRKLKALERGEEIDGDQPFMSDHDYYEGPERQPPCLGLCHYFRTIGVENPFNKENGEQDDATFYEGVDRKEPCLGLCHYYRTLGIPNPFEEKQRKEKESQPCIGLCHYYRTLGIPNPFEERQLKRFSSTEAGEVGEAGGVETGEDDRVEDEAMTMGLEDGPTADTQ